MCFKRKAERMHVPHEKWRDEIKEKDMCVLFSSI